jgi:hypothetical protein
MNNNLLTYEEFLVESSLQAMAESLLVDNKKSIFEAICKSSYFSKDEKIAAEIIIETQQWSYVFDGTLNEESLINKWKEKAENALQTLKDKGKDYLSNTQEAILKIGGSIKSLIGKVLTFIKEFLVKAWEWISSQVAEAYDKIKKEIVEKIKEELKKGKVKEASKEIENLKAMASAAKKWCVSGVVGDMGGGMQKAAMANESYILAVENALYYGVADMLIENEEFVNYLREGEDAGGIKIPFLSALSHKLAEYPPFSTLHKIEHVAEKGMNTGLAKVSSFLTKAANAPGPFEFSFLGKIFGLLTGHVIKTSVKTAVASIGASAVLMSIPGLGTVLLCMKYTAKGIWLTGVVETALTAVTGNDDKEEEDNLKQA